MLTLKLGFTTIATPEELPHAERRESSEPLLGRSMSSSNYGGFSEEVDPSYLGVAKQGAGWLNRLLFVWVNQLIQKGLRGAGNGGLSSSDDLFDLPDELAVHAASDKFQHQWEALERTVPPPTPTPAPTHQSSTSPGGGRVGLLRLLYACFGREFLAIGVLKFGQDCAGFAGPILLNLVVNFMEDPTVPMSQGYVYALLLVSDQSLD